MGIRNLRNHTGHGNRLGRARQSRLGHHIAGRHGVRFITVGVQLIIGREGRVDNSAGSVVKLGGFLLLSRHLSRTSSGDTNLSGYIVQNIAHSARLHGLIARLFGRFLLRQNAAQTLVSHLVERH